MNDIIRISILRSLSFHILRRLELPGTPDEPLLFFLTSGLWDRLRKGLSGFAVVEVVGMVEWGVVACRAWSIWF